jgi:hypothetical protein
MMEQIIFIYYNISLKHKRVERNIVDVNNPYEIVKIKAHFFSSYRVLLLIFMNL